MPNQTFFNLPTSKQQMLMNAAKMEFARVPLHEASIANIIKEANIARGSFYQYFEDKEDLYFYLLQLDTEIRRQKFITQLKENDGDFFAALKDNLKSIIIDEIDHEEAQNFYRHVFLNMNYKTEKTFMTSKMDAEINQYIEHISQLIDKSNLQLSNENDLTQMIHIATTVMLHNIVAKFAKNLTNEQVIDNFTHQLHLLKRGFMRQK